jgi:iron complex transport system permease protein
VTTILRTRRPELSARVHVRTAATAVASLLAIGAVAAFTLSTGGFPVPLGEVVRTLLTDGDPAYEYIVADVRLPRLVTALLVGAALAAAGAVFQSLTRNPLGSPDVIGCTQGAATGALLVILVVGGGIVQLAAGAVAGGVLAALIVLGLSHRRSLHGYRLVLIGIGLGATLLAANNFLLTRANLEKAQIAQAWLVGSLNARGWEYVGPLAVALALLLPPTVLLGRWLSVMELGDEAATALGIPTDRARTALLLMAACLAAVATAAAGPVIFLALAAPQIARRVARAPGPVVLTSALVGALLLAVSDLAAQRLFEPQLPVGIATGAVGGVYLAWLLARQWRSEGAS